MVRIQSKSPWNVHGRPPTLAPPTDVPIPGETCAVTTFDLAFRGELSRFDWMGSTDGVGGLLPGRSFALGLCWACDLKLQYGVHRAFFFPCSRFTPSYHGRS